MTSLTNSPVTAPPPLPSPPDTRSPAARADISLALLSPARQHILRLPPAATSPRSPPAPPQRHRAHGPACCPLRSSLLRASATQLHGRDNKTYLRQRPCQLKEELQAHRERPETVQPPPDPFPSRRTLKLLSPCASHRCSAHRWDPLRSLSQPRSTLGIRKQQRCYLLRWSRSHPSSCLLCPFCSAHLVPAEPANPTCSCGQDPCSGHLTPGRDGALRGHASPRVQGEEAPSSASPSPLPRGTSSRQSFKEMEMPRALTGGSHGRPSVPSRRQFATASLGLYAPGTAMGAKL